MDQEYGDMANDLVIDVCELSVSLGNYTHDMCKSTKILEQHPAASSGGYTELDLVHKFQQKFEELKQRADAKERVLHEARCKRLLQLHKELQDLEPDVDKRVQYLVLFYELFDSDRKKCRSVKVSKAVNMQLKRSLSAGNILESRNLQKEDTSTVYSLNRELIFEKEIAIIYRKSEQVQIENYKRIERCVLRIPCCPTGFVWEKGFAEVKTLTYSIGFETQQCEPESLSLKEVIDSDETQVERTTSTVNSTHTLPTLYEALNIPAFDFERLTDNTAIYVSSSEDSDDDIDKLFLNYGLDRKKSMGKYILENEAVGDVSHRTPNHSSSKNTDNSFLDAEYGSEGDNLKTDNPENNLESIQCLGNTENGLEIPTDPETQSQAGEEELPGLENELDLNLATESSEESEQEGLTPIFNELRRAVSNIKTNILRRIDESLSVLSLQSQSEDEISEESVTGVEKLMKIHMDNYENEKLIQSQNHEAQAEENHDSVEEVHWQHQHHIIIAPRVIIQLFKSNPAYMCAPNDPQAPNFYDQVNQFYEIIGQKNSSQFEIGSIEKRLSQILHAIKRELPRNITYSEWVAAVAKCQLKQLLLPEELCAYDSLCRHLRDEGEGGRYPTNDQESRFRDALNGMMGRESQHLRASPVTGRLQIRSPHHQESISESYLLLILGLLGYQYNSLKEQLKGLEQRGDTGVYLGRGIKNKLMTYRQFLERKKNQPCSLLGLYWQTRKYHLLLHWLLEVLTKINQGQAIVLSLYEESRLRIGDQHRLIQMWLSQAIKPQVSRLSCWLSDGQLSASNGDEFIIESSLSSTLVDFWQKRYRLTEPFTNFFNSQLSETMISVGKTVAYSREYLGRNVEIALDSRGLKRKVYDMLTLLYQYGDQEPLFDFLLKLHSEVSGKVLRFLRCMNSTPKDVFYQIHKYLMITDMHFYRELMDTLEEPLEEPACEFNAKVFTKMIHRLLPRQTADLYVDKSVGQEDKCWSCFLLRLKLPDYWRALLGEDIGEYDVIFTGLWKFHYANYVLCKIIGRQETHSEKSSNARYFDCIEEVDELLEMLIGLLWNVMNVLKDYFLRDLLETAYIKLRLDCGVAKTIDDMLSANRTYLRTIRLGSFQTKSQRRCNMYLGQLFDCIMCLDFQEHKYFRLLQSFMDYLTKYGGQTSGRNGFLIPSIELTDRKREFCWSCQNAIDALTTIKDQFHTAMQDLLFSLHISDIETFRILAQKLDRKGYYELRDKRLQAVQRCKFMRIVQ